MSRLLVIGCGGVASVAIHKCCQLSEVFTELCIASRTKSKCDALKKELEGKTNTKLTTAQLDADHVDEIIALINSYKPDAVLNVASRLILTIPGSGLTGSVSRRQESQAFWEAALTLELRACSRLMRSSIILTKSTQ